MTYVFKSADAGVPEENSRGCLPVLIVLFILGIVLACCFLIATGLIVAVFLAVVYYLVPIAILVLLLIVVVVMAAVRRPVQNGVRHLIIDERGISDRFGTATIHMRWSEIAAVELSPPRLLIHKHVGYPAKYLLAPTKVDVDAFVDFCREQILIHGQDSSAGT